MTIVLLILAIVLVLFAIAMIIVTYRTDRDTWEKLQDIENRMKRLERRDD